MEDFLLYALSGFIFDPWGTLKSRIMQVEKGSMLSLFVTGKDTSIQAACHYKIQ